MLHRVVRMDDVVFTERFLAVLLRLRLCVIRTKRNTPAIRRPLERTYAGFVVRQLHGLAAIRPHQVDLALVRGRLGQLSGTVRYKGNPLSIRRPRRVMRRLHGGCQPMRVSITSRRCNVQIRLERIRLPVRPALQIQHMQAIGGNLRLRHRGHLQRLVDRRRLQRLRHQHVRNKQQHQ